MCIDELEDWRKGQAMSKASDPVTPDRLKEIRERAEKAIAGPWYADGLDRFSSDEPWVFCVVTRHSDGSFNDIICHVPSDVESNNTADHPADTIATHEFIAHAREDIPYLLERIESEREAAERETLEKVVKAICPWCASPDKWQRARYCELEENWEHLGIEVSALTTCEAHAIHELARGKQEERRDG